MRSQSEGPHNRRALKIPRAVTPNDLAELVQFWVGLRSVLAQPDF